MDWIQQYKPLFDELTRKKYGMSSDFATIERKLARLRDGDILTYEDLEMIAREDLWSFNRYWIWPSKEQIGDQLERSGHLLINPLLEPAREDDMIIGFLEIFKNISLVSILLRFIWPEHYAIYSRPILWVLRLERGRSDFEEFLLLTQKMRAMRNWFGVDRTADVDTIVWAASRDDELFDRVQEMIAPRIPKEYSFREIMQHSIDDPLSVARSFYDFADFQTSGYWASRAFEKYLFERCKAIYGYIPHNESREVGDLEFLISRICPESSSTPHKKHLVDLKRLRNDAVHIEKRFNKEMAEALITGMEEILSEMA